MPRFICDYLNEIVLLSDGRVTTCCLDPLGFNAFANINKLDFFNIRQSYIKFREQITKDVLSMPRCTICYSKLKQAGFPATGTYQIDPTSNTIELFLNNSEQVTTQFVIELSSQCNLRCNGCMQSRYDFRKYRSKPFMDMNHLQSWLGSNITDISKIRLYNYGETFMHPKSIEFCSFIKHHNPNTFIEIATNGLLLHTPERRTALLKTGVDTLIFSIHGSSQETVEKYMTPRFHFQKILEILKDLVAVRAELNFTKPLMFWKYLLFEWNDSDEKIHRARLLSKEIGLDGLQFCLVGYPSPSKRFTANSPEWKNLQATGNR